MRKRGRSFTTTLGKKEKVTTLRKGRGLFRSRRRTGRGKGSRCPLGKVVSRRHQIRGKTPDSLSLPEEGGGRGTSVRKGRTCPRRRTSERMCSRKRGILFLHKVGGKGEKTLLYYTSVVEKESQPSLHFSPGQEKRLGGVIEEKGGGKKKGRRWCPALHSCR